MILTVKLSKYEKHISKFFSDKKKRQDLLLFISLLFQYYNHPKMTVSSWYDFKNHKINKKATQEDNSSEFV